MNEGLGTHTYRAQKSNMHIINGSIRLLAFLVSTAY